MSALQCPGVCVGGKGIGWFVGRAGLGLRVVLDLVLEVLRVLVLASG